MRAHTNNKSNKTKTKMTGITNNNNKKATQK